MITLKAFWAVVKDRCPQAKIPHLMTDDGKYVKLYTCMYIKNSSHRPGWGTGLFSSVSWSQTPTVYMAC